MCVKVFSKMCIFCIICCGNYFLSFFTLITYSSFLCLLSVMPAAIFGINVELLVVFCPAGKLASGNSTLKCSESSWNSTKCRNFTEILYIKVKFEIFICIFHLCQLNILRICAKVISKMCIIDVICCEIYFLSFFTYIQLFPLCSINNACEHI